MIMEKIITTIAFLLIVFYSNGQDKYFTKSGKIIFSATAPSSPESIDGVNKSITCVLDVKTGSIQFGLLMKGFEFERALMQEHFNENYVESDKFPKADFKGTIINNAAVNYTKDGNYPIRVKGKLSIHGELKEIETEGKLLVKDGKINAFADFPVVLSDFKIAIPALVADKVSTTAKINVNCVLEPLK
jgi:polyisoprenoid-binding protein YceI